MLRKKSRSNGFTMIELLMVIMLVAILGAVALPQFLDFRNEGRIAAAQSILQSLKTGIKLQKANAKLRCDADFASTIPFDSFQANDITAGASPLCTTSQIPVSTERRFIDSNGFPKNPYNDLTSVGDCSSTTYVGYCYDQASETVSVSTTTTNTLTCTVCSMISDNGPSSADLSCNGSGCTMQANNNGSGVSLNCAEGYCNQTANNNGSGATLTCDGGHCNMTCDNNGSSCSLSCAGGGCNFSCSGNGSSCDMDCAGGGCTVVACASNGAGCSGP